LLPRDVAEVAGFFLAGAEVQVAGFLGDGLILQAQALGLGGGGALGFALGGAGGAENDPVLCIRALQARQHRFRVACFHIETGSHCHDLWQASVEAMLALLGQPSYRASREAAEVIAFRARSISSVVEKRPTENLRHSAASSGASPMADAT